MHPGVLYDMALVASKQIIDEADPEGLLGMGAPVDEYDSWSADVARRLLHGEDPAAIVGAWTPWRGARTTNWCIERLREAQRDLLSDPSA